MPSAPSDALLLIEELKAIVLLCVAVLTNILLLLLLFVFTGDMSIEVMGRCMPLVGDPIGDMSGKLVSKVKSSTALGRRFPSKGVYGLPRLLSSYRSLRDSNVFCANRISFLLNMAEQ